MTFLRETRRPGRPPAKRSWICGPGKSAKVRGSPGGGANLLKCRAALILRTPQWVRAAPRSLRWCRRGSDRTSYIVTFLDDIHRSPCVPIQDAMLAAEATPWRQPLSHDMAAASGHVMTLRFKAGRALDAQEAGLEHFGGGRPSNAD